MQHKLYGRQVVSSSLRRLQCFSQRHHAERQEPAELRSICPPVRKQQQQGLICCIGWRLKLVSDFLSVTTASVTVRRTSLWMTTRHSSMKLRSAWTVRPSVRRSDRLLLHWLLHCITRSFSVCRSRQRLRQRLVSRGRPERLLRLHPLLRQRGWWGSPPPRGMLGKSGVQCRQETTTPRYVSSFNDHFSAERERESLLSLTMILKYILNKQCRLLGCSEYQ